MLLSASNLHRFALCPSSVLLPREQSTFSQNAAKGTNIHEFIGNCITHGEEKARASMPDRYPGKAVVGRIKFSEVIPDLVKPVSELAVYWKVDPDGQDEFKVLGENIGRNYFQAGAENYNYVGSIDILATNELANRLVVADIKTGMQEITAVESEQLQLLAYIVAKIYSLDSIETRIIKIRDDGSVRTSTHTIYEKELNLIGLRLRAIHQRIKDNLLEYTKGQETEFFAEEKICKYCPCKSKCPAWKADNECPSTVE